MKLFTKLALLLICILIQRDTHSLAQIHNTQKAIQPKTTSNDNKELIHLIPNYHAIVIGINQYKDDPYGWNDLKTAKNDAQSVATILHDKYGFTVHKLIDEKATRSAIIQTLDTLPKFNENDAVLIYYAGHGFYDEILDEGYWIPSDGIKEVNGYYHKASWIGNATIETFIRGCNARHLLLISDSCYSGSLFRGHKSDSTMSHKAYWYQRILSQPSRFFITSGALEPVPDNGIRHSVFAQKLLHFLNHPDHMVFSASELGRALQPSVADLTGQLPLIGPMKMAKHAGGELVFIRNDFDFPTTVDPFDAAFEQRGNIKIPPRNQDELMQDAIILQQTGAVNSMQNLLDQALQRYGENSISKELISSLTPEGELQNATNLNSLSNQVGPNYDAHYARPRILLMLEPKVLESGTFSQAKALLLGRLLALELKHWDGVQFVKRDNLEAVLNELKLGTSALSDTRAKSEIGKLLPASMILIGEIIPDEEGQWLNFVLEDTETTREFATFLEETKSSEPLQVVAKQLAKKIAQAISQYKPLTAKILGEENGILQAGVGWFHGAKKDMSFIIQEYEPVHLKDQIEFRKKKVGTATLIAVAENISDFKPHFDDGYQTNDINRLWVKESTE